MERVHVLSATASAPAGAARVAKSTSSVTKPYLRACFAGTPLRSVKACKKVSAAQMRGLSIKAKAVAQSTTTTTVPATKQVVADPAKPSGQKPDALGRFGAPLAGSPEVQGATLIDDKVRVLLLV